MKNMNLAMIAGLAWVVGCSGGSSGSDTSKSSGGSSAAAGRSGSVAVGGSTLASSASSSSSSSAAPGGKTTPVAGGDTGSAGRSTEATLSSGGSTTQGGSVSGGSSASSAGGTGSGVTSTSGGTTSGGTGGSKPATGGSLGGTSTNSAGGTGTNPGQGGTGGTGGTSSARTGGSTDPGSGGTSGTAGSTGNTGPAALVTCPNLPGAVVSPLYSVTVGGKPLFVEKLTKFNTEMQVHYAHGSLSGTGTAAIAVTVSESFNSYKLSPKSRGITASKSGNTITFNSGPNYFILQFDAKELLFILLDAEETNPPKVGDANVKSIADYDVDNTGASLVTSKIQSAINAASTGTQNILYFPPGKYKVGELAMKSNVTMYLACGAVLYGSDKTGDFNNVSGGINIEGAQHALIRMVQVKNAKILGRGVLDSNGHAIRAAGLNANLLKIEQSSNILVDGIVARDSSYWNTLIYRSDQVTIQNYKVINCRPTTTMYNQTDGVDFDESTNGKLYNAFLYTGDDGMATKNEEASGTVNTKNILHEHIVVYNNSVGTKVGTKSMGQTMDGITFKDVDVVKAGRGMTIECYDTALVSKVTFEDIRVEAADSMLINLALDQPPDWREAANTTKYKDVYFTDVSSEVKKTINLHGKSSAVNIDGVHFKNLTVQGKKIASQTDANASWSINQYVSGITFE